MFLFYILLMTQYTYAFMMLLYSVCLSNRRWAYYSFYKYYMYTIKCLVKNMIAMPRSKGCIWLILYFLLTTCVYVFPVEKHETRRILETSEKRYYCCNCGRHYNWQKSLNRHLKFECDVRKRFYCNLCFKTFNRKYELTKHMGRTHPNSIIPNNNYCNY